MLLPAPPRMGPPRALPTASQPRGGPRTLKLAPDELGSGRERSDELGFRRGDVTYDESCACPHAALSMLENTLLSQDLKGLPFSPCLKCGKTPPKTGERACWERRAAGDGIPRVRLSPKTVAASCISMARASRQPGAPLRQKDAVPLREAAWRRRPQARTSRLLAEHALAGAGGARQPGEDRSAALTRGRGRTFGGTTEVLTQISMEPLLLPGCKLSKGNSSLPWCFGGEYLA